MLQRLASDEYALPPAPPREREAFLGARDDAARGCRSLGVSRARYAASRLGTAAALLAIDRASGRGFYDVPPDAARDPDAAEEALRGDGTVVDVQTHYVGHGRTRTAGTDGILAFIRQVAPDRFRSLDRDASLGFGEFLRCVYLESETAVAVLTAAPGAAHENILPNDEIAGTRALLEQLAGGPRLLHHAIVHPDDPRERDALDDTLARFSPCGLKVYTLYGHPRAERPGGWRLDDDDVGAPFLERARDLGVRRICAHKGLSMLAPTGSPADVGPAARRFPELAFLVYHSGYEITGEAAAEGPYGDRVRHLGTNRLVASLRDAGVAPGSNVYAELGSTWYCLMRRPEEAAHVIGKLLLAVGEDNVVWGTDSVWYGPAQPLIDAFRAFRIPDRLREAHGYPSLTPERKRKILGGNAARVYGIDLDAARRAAASDDLAWIRDAVEAETRR